MSKIIYSILIMLLFFFSACSADGKDNRLNFAQSLLTKSNKKWELIQFISEETYTLKNGSKFSVMHLKGKFYDDEIFEALIQFPHGINNPDLVGYYLKSKTKILADGLVIFPNGSVTHYTNFSQVGF